MLSSQAAKKSLQEEVLSLRGRIRQLSEQLQRQSVQTSTSNDIQNSGDLEPPVGESGGRPVIRWVRKLAGRVSGAGPVGHDRRNSTSAAASPLSSGYTRNSSTVNSRHVEDAQKLGKCDS